MARSISRSVGRMGGVNLPDDVKTVQELLNQVPVASGGPMPLLAVDGICGPKTIAAIQTFQVKNFGWKIADGRVDPDGPTHALLNTFDTPVPGKKPPVMQTLPTSTRFVIHRMGSATTFMPRDQELFFHLTDMVNGLIGIYWLQQSGRPMTVLQPPASFVCPSRSFNTRGPYAVDKLGCPAMYGSSEVSGRITSRMTLFLSTGAVQIDMPHHLLGPGGVVSPGKGDISTAIAGDLRFVKMG